MTVIVWTEKKMQLRKKVILISERNNSWKGKGAFQMEVPGGKKVSGKGADCPRD